MLHSKFSPTASQNPIADNPNKDGTNKFHNIQTGNPNAMQTIDIRSIPDNSISKKFDIWLFIHLYFHIILECCYIILLE
jgi:hypothetical protein